MDVDFKLEDPFFKNKLNPYFFDQFNTYWNLTKEARDVDENMLIKTRHNLIRVLFLRLFQPLYLHYPPSIAGSVFFLSHILSDGIGDYFSLLKSASILKQQSPHLEVQLAYVHKTPLPIIYPASYLLSKKSLHEFNEKPDRPILETILEGKRVHSAINEISQWERKKNDLQADYKKILSKHGQRVIALEEMEAEAIHELELLNTQEKMKKEAEKLYKKMKKSLALVHIATALNTFENPVLSFKSFYFAEAGNFQGIGNLLQRNWFSMGLQPFEEGFFLKESFAETMDWQETKLPLILWKKAIPSSSEIKSYSLQQSLHLGYLSKIPKQQSIFIHLICLLQKSDPRHIDIVLSRFNSHIPLLSPVWLANQGIKKVTLIHPQNTHEELLLETKASSDKTLRLIYILPIPTSDFKRLLNLSSDLVGCTGDGSLSDCLTLGKIPFYEMRKHKLPSWKALLDLASYLNLSEVYQYGKKMLDYEKNDAEKTAEEIYHSIQHKNFKYEWGQFIQFIKQYYCFEDALLAILNRQFYLTEYPTIREKENSLILDYLNQAITASEAYETFEKTLLLFRQLAKNYHREHKTRL
jgi:hypothetical protein